MVIYIKQKLVLQGYCPCKSPSFGNINKIITYIISGEPSWAEPGRLLMLKQNSPPQYSYDEAWQIWHSL